ncbi:MAG: hypothetical protein KF878_17965 [Planctomycetes bacterium]|nr:hypothetical protein [Planctomycetota bacterium]
MTIIRWPRGAAPRPLRRAARVAVLVGLLPGSASAPPAAPPPPPPPAAAAEVAPPEPAGLQGSAVVVGGETLGFVALTGKRTWSVYDPRQQQIAVLSSEAGKFTIFWLGARPEDSLEYLLADSFPAALAAAFDLDQPPQLRTALISPQQRAEAPPARPATQRLSAVRVIYRHRPVGLVRPGEIAGTWSVLGRDKEQVAMIAPASGRWRVLMLGASPEDSLDFDDHADFVEAVQVAFELPERPTLDPPIAPTAPQDR